MENAPKTLDSSDLFIKIHCIHSKSGDTIPSSSLENFDFWFSEFSIHVKSGGENGIGMGVVK